MSDISTSSLGESFDAEFERQIAQAKSADEIKLIMQDRAVRTLPGVSRDIYDPNVILVDEATLRAPQLFTKTVTLNGVAHTISGASQHELDVAETELFRSQLTPEHTDATRDERGRFTADATLPALSADDAVRQVELRLQLIRGEISTEEYLLQSGAFERHMEQREIVRARQGWESATQEFLQSPEGANWPGGDKGLQRMGELIAANQMMDAEDKVAVLKEGWRLIQEQDYTQAVESKLKDVKSPAELRAALDSVRGGSSSSSFFGGR